jgi:hypothetical protein
MKFNKWTLGLAAVGAISIVSAARADEKMNSLQTALSNTTISGSVSASANWQVTPGPSDYKGAASDLIPFQGQSKQDGFNLDVVRLTIAKPEDESPWASGYQVDLMFGPDAVAYNPSANANQLASSSGHHFSWITTSGSDFAIKQAYVTLRTPVGNGIDWKIGVFDTIIGYEVTDAQNDPNYTRSWGYAIEPTEHTGILATYAINSQLSVSAGIANTLSAGINARDTYSPSGASDWQKTYMGSITYTAPSSMGWAAGSSMYAGIVYGFNSVDVTGYNHGNQANYYAGVTMNTPVKQLTTGLAFDYAQHFDGAPVDVYVFGLYGTYKATDKLSVSARGEYVGLSANQGSFGSAGTPDLMELTGTVEYDLWANVMTRLEVRWDHVLDNGNVFASGAEYASGDAFDSFTRGGVGLYANVIYKF